MLHENCKLKIHQLQNANPKSGDVGVELEVEGDNLPLDVPGWVIKPEGSLRGKGGRTVSADENAPDVPHEYVSHRPVAIGGLHSKLNNLYKALSQEHVKVRLTERASTHIHVNMSDQTIRNVIGFLAVFAMIEPVLLRVCGNSRNGNLFCLPSYETGDLPNFTQRIVNAIYAGPARSWPVKRGKYAALNTDPLLSLGSLEVRCFPNEVSPDQIFTWASWLINLRELVSDWEDDTFMSLLDRAYNEPQWLLQRIFGNEQLFVKCYPNNPAQLVTFGVEQAYEILKAANPVLDYNKELQPKRGKTSKLSWSQPAFDEFIDDMPPMEDEGP
ncbi:MAG TPA: hypothetical protein VIY48_18645 [Candidatus Paceibacterota bacterium]